MTTAGCGKRSSATGIFHARDRRRRVLRVSAEHNPDLFWAIRGGGGNFGIVTSFEFDLVKLGSEVYGGIVLLASLQLFGNVLASSIQKRLFTQHQSMLDASAPAG